MRRYELTDGQWESVEPALPKNGRRGGQWRDHRAVLNGILWALHTGAQRREVPDRYGPWKTVHGRFARRAKDGTLLAILEALRLKLDERGRIGADLWCADATVVRASRSAAGARRGGKGGERNRPTNRSANRADQALGRSRGGYGAKVHLVCDGGGLPLAAEIAPGRPMSRNG